MYVVNVNSIKCVYDRIGTEYHPRADSRSLWGSVKKFLRGRVYRQIRKISDKSHVEKRIDQLYEYVTTSVRS